MPANFTAKSSATAARKLAKRADGELADAVARRLDADRDTVAEVLGAVGNGFHDVAVIATREAERCAELGDLSSLVVTAPMLDRDVNDVADLLELAVGFAA